MAEWTHRKGDKYRITGTDRTGKRFDPIVTDNPYYALGFNIWRGTLYLVRDGKKTVLKTYFN